MGGPATASRAAAIYLNDHFAGATAGTELAKRMAKEHRPSPYGDVLEDLLRGISWDRQELLGIMASLGVPVRRYKVYGAWLGEKLGRLKPNGRVIRRAGLSLLIELEGLRVGVEGKALLWQALLASGIASRASGLDVAQLRELQERAQQQMQALDSLHTEAAMALVSDRPGDGKSPPES
ncbi:hypothetical protein ACZ90_67630 [Streptomyces albus subsp. albus]|nr:hypothetical protein ACZ90_67630 [Streptomyces albus subsp. albus]